ncbi:MAG: hypothetical protein RLZZ303_1666 [Candidatus Hydrogenedentota bacterium]
MPQNRPTIVLLLLLALIVPWSAYAADPALRYEALPPLPEALSGHFAGTVNGVLVVAGGTSFPVSPWQGGTKYWHNRVYRLYDGEPSAWFVADKLAVPRAYGAGVTHPSGCHLIGGSNGQYHLDDVVRLTALEGNLAVEVLPARLPVPLAYHAAALVKDTVYVCGGQSAPGDGIALNTLWSLDLSNPDAEWQALEPLPGLGRILPCMAELGNSVYVASGAALSKGADGAEQREYLTDVWRYTPGNGWSQAPPLPHATVAAASTTEGDARWLIHGGDTGALFARNAELGDQHPGFSRSVLAYSPNLNTWAVVGEMADPVVTVPVAEWKDNPVLVGGEDRPGHRIGNAYAVKVLAERQRLNAVDYTVIAVYLGVVVLIGFYFSRREADTRRFFLGSGHVPWWAVGLSIFATSLSAITYLSIPARAFATNWNMIFANLGVLVVTPFVVLSYIPRFRQLNIKTAYEYLELRFNFPLRIYGSLCFLLFQFGRVSIVLFLPALALSETTGMDPTVCILLMGVMATTYTVMGGIEAVIWTDVLQACVFVFGAVFALYLVAANVDGGFAGVIEAGSAAGKFNLSNGAWSYASDSMWVIILGNIFSSFYPSTADQTVVQRYLTTRDSKTAGRAALTNMFFTIPITLLFFSLGTALWAYFQQHPLLLPPGMKNDAVLPVFIMAEFPVGLRGLIIAGIFAAAMSSLDSSINSVSSVIVNDYLRRFAARGWSEKAMLRAARMVTLACGVFGTCAAIYIARINAVSLWDPFLALLGLAGGGLAGIFALGIYVPRANAIGAMAGAGLSAVILLAVRQLTDVHPLLYGMIGFLAAFGFGWAASLLAPAPLRKP